MTAVADEIDGQIEACAGLAFNEHLRASTWRGAGPGGAWLEAWLAAGGATAEVDFIRRGALQSRVRAIGVVPGDDESDFAMHGAAYERHDGQGSAVFLERADEALDDGD